MFGLLQERVVWLADRPYLPQGLPVRTIALLASLLQVGPILICNIGYGVVSMQCVIHCMHVRYAANLICPAWWRSQHKAKLAPICTVIKRAT